jgi:hypothetical protein
MHDLVKKIMPRIFGKEDFSFLLIAKAFKPALLLGWEVKNFNILNTRFC